MKTLEGFEEGPLKFAWDMRGGITSVKQHSKGGSAKFHLV